MEAITRKGDVKDIMANAAEVYREEGPAATAANLEKELLNKKVKFPLLEYAATLLYDEVPEGEQIELLDHIIALHTMGGNVLAGIVLQLRLPGFFLQSIEKAIDFIIMGDEWYVCDIIGERVMGHALLTLPEQAVPVLQKLACHPDKWIVRSVGVATHYAVKKGLEKEYVEDMFVLLLSLADATEFHTKKGVGWGAKTIAKIHPALIEQYARELEEERVKQWFRTKIKTGLGRAEFYASKHQG